MRITGETPKWIVSLCFIMWLCSAAAIGFLSIFLEGIPSFITGFASGALVVLACVWYKSLR